MHYYICHTCARMYVLLRVCYTHMYMYYLQLPLLVLTYFLPFPSSEYFNTIKQLCRKLLYMYIADQINIYVFQHAVANSRHTMVYVGDIHDYFY